MKGNSDNIKPYVSSNKGIPKGSAALRTKGQFWINLTWYGNYNVTDDFLCQSVVLGPLRHQKKQQAFGDEEIAFLVPF